jgi:dynein heavy chain, axonemal
MHTPGSHLQPSDPVKQTQHIFTGFGSLSKDLEKNSDEWLAWCNNEAPERAAMPGDWARMPEFKQLLLLRALRPDRVTNALLRFCEAVMGSPYVNQDAFDPAVVMQESSRCVQACMH